MKKKQTQPRKSSKLYRLLEYLRANIAVTAIDINNALHTSAATRLISQLRHRYRMRIICEMTTGLDGVRYGLYTLVE